MVEAVINAFAARTGGDRRFCGHDVACGRGPGRAGESVICGPAAARRRSDARPRRARPAPRRRAGGLHRDPPGAASRHRATGGATRGTKRRAILMMTGGRDIIRDATWSQPVRFQEPGGGASVTIVAGRGQMRRMAPLVIGRFRVRVRRRLTHSWRCRVLHTRGGHRARARRD
jgi:hypothetical protein